MSLSLLCWPPFSALCLTDIPSVVVSLSSPASLLGDLLSMEDDCASVVVLRSPLIPPAFVSWSRRQGQFWVSSEHLGYGGESLLVVFPCSGSQCQSLMRINVVLRCCSPPLSSFPVTASVASISAVRVLVLRFLPCGVSSFYRAGREEQRWLFAVIGVWGFDRLWFVGFAALVRPHCRLLRAPSSRWCLCSLQVEGLRGEVMFWRRVPGQANITGL
ncbi:hypothetical protein F2Q69_00011437 [Brassica cretica]|uniref:Secreted protein n=1 Tax=Brassica cretica TaxID=69181 RepID=A0A8S9R620_BRACR|nr:hypothetical protein F2Q69_00011437 [Brassica cretica]